MSDAATDLDLSILPPNYRAAFEVLQATATRAAELEDIVKRLEHLVAELNHVLHGKKSEKLSEDERQLAFEDLQIAVAETEEQKQDQAPNEATPKRKRVAEYCAAVHTVPTFSTLVGLELPRVNFLLERFGVQFPAGLKVASGFGGEKSSRRREYKVDLS